MYSDRHAASDWWINVECTLQAELWAQHTIATACYYLTEATRTGKLKDADCDGQLAWFAQGQNDFAYLWVVASPSRLCLQNVEPSQTVTTFPYCCYRHIVSLHVFCLCSLLKNGWQYGADCKTCKTYGSIEVVPAFLAHHSIFEFPFRLCTLEIVMICHAICDKPMPSFSYYLFPGKPCFTWCLLT